LLSLLAEAMLVLAACLAAIQLRRSGEARMVPRPPRALVPWLVVLLGVAGALAFLVFVVQSLEVDPGRRYVVPNLWSVGMAFVVPLAAVGVTPRGLGAALLGGWGGGSAAGLVYNVVSYWAAVSAAVPSLIVSGCALLALLVLVVPLARSAPTPQDDQAPG
jgi:hypothetical protein